MDGYVNVDRDPYAKADQYFDLTTTWPIATDSVDEVIAHHLFEHIGPEFFFFLKELYRVCAHGATIHIVVPHHNHDCFKNDPTHARPITVEGLRLFDKAFNRLCIETEDGASRLGLYYDVDFEIVKFQFLFDPFYEPYLENLRNEKEPRRQQEKEKELQRMARELNNVILETHVTWRVQKEV